MKRINVFRSVILLLFTFELFTLGLGNAISVSWNGTTWALLSEENGSYYLTTVVPDGHLSKVPLHLNGTPCGLAWNGSEWLIETFVPDSVVVQTLNGSVLFGIHSYDCRGFAYLNGTYYVPISESARMGDCSLFQVSSNGSVEKTIPCGSIDGAGIKAVEGRLYFINCTRVYVYSNGAFKRVLQLDNCAEDFDILNGKILLCSNGLIEHSKNGTKEITDSCDAISCNGRECLIASNGTLYIYDGNLSTLEIEEKARNINPKTVAVGVFLVFLTIWLLMRRKSA
ncbi:hypothetical protein APY94_07925 [Thermococcus celericrescens]|uniref:Uncharacterized protein n=1 Tax=Thermococcus celericrescens TaxID=227598 RepID=A0A100XX84_9EURY|nr:hypothetical protein APY94_07925 [Thermococcus celericrescens]